PRCGPPPTRWPAMRSAPSCWKSGGRRTSSISSPAASSHWPRQPPASPPCCCGWRRSRGPRPRKPDGSCARHIRRRLRPGTPGARLFSTRNWFVTVMARSAAGSWNGNVMSASSANRRRILSLWLPRLPIYRIKRKLSGNSDALDKTPSVVVAKQHNAILIYALDDLAIRSGLSIGLPLANARAICPELTVFDADEVADRKTLEDIADWCDRFTPLVALDPPHGLYLDITGCAHLFGGERALLQIVSGALSRRGFAVGAAIASTSICARTLTRHGAGQIIADGEEAEAVSPLPVSALGAGDAITGGLRRAGLKTIGDVASRGRHEITARFGSGFTTLLEQALGEGDAPI